MINHRQSERFTGIIRKLFVIFLIFIFIVTTGSFILRHTITTKLDRLSSQLHEPWQQPAINRLLVDLNLTENSFQQASANGQVSDLEAYKNHLKDIFAKMGNIIQRYKADGNSNIPKSKQQIALALQQKIAVSQQLFDLQKRFTSLLEKTTLGSINDRSSAKGFERGNMQTDTSVSVYKEPTKSSLIKRLKDAVKNTSNVKVLTIKQLKNQEKANIQLDQTNLLKELGQQYDALGQSNQEMILANLNLLTELRQLLLNVQAIERVAYEKSREEILEEYRSTSRDLNTFTGIASLFILLFIIILIIYIRKASGAERRYIMENSRAVRLAGQKSEILAIMSHEIRNKLMAINGAVFMLKRTTLLPEQEKKISSINLSSFLLLETVNNVLDVSKLEQSVAELKINPFLPYQAISDSVEAMRFMAEKKGIDLNFEFEGINDLSVNGDDLRLKQVLINLLSNAIKYTDKGHVNLSAKLQEKGNASFLLTVSVKDTGSGIPKNKQAGLFSPYYQAGGQKRGTGLGLYLCRQLVKLQGGTIELESDEGQGCLVRFSIPY
ncbi:sensor histidine kinase [Pedobacter rhodius]|uniref:histidine kinase n=1 Tax=Pedobacter rhodius TaxID=3004098 RepID=A0ABT4L153_9SPHI|nr:HAMP domain-containing sensor histidine kinase [Pedobacter sp. SJ11]MCZ4224916.1 HAMP domain-containing sensor histidine kinase [Pedobacter sp. SJ11]